MLQNLFSMQYVLLLLAAFIGAAAHYVKGKTIEASPLGFYEWLLSESPAKSLSVGALIAVGTAILAILGIQGFFGMLLAGTGGYCIDSVMKRIPDNLLRKP